MKVSLLFIEHRLRKLRHRRKALLGAAIEQEAHSPGLADILTLYALQDVLMAANLIRIHQETLHETH